ncbi:hypothetical protein ACLOJK_039277 [Asimina triloba]
MDSLLTTNWRRWALTADWRRWACCYCCPLSGMGVATGLLDKKCWGCRIWIELSLEVPDLDGPAAAAMAAGSRRARCHTCCCSIWVSSQWAAGFAAVIGFRSLALLKKKSRLAIMKMKSSCCCQAFGRLGSVDRCSDLPDLENPSPSLTDDWRWFSPSLGRRSNLKKRDRVKHFASFVLGGLDLSLMSLPESSSSAAMAAGLKEDDGAPYWCSDGVLKMGSPKLGVDEPADNGSRAIEMGDPHQSRDRATEETIILYCRSNEPMMTWVNKKKDVVNRNSLASGGDPPLLTPLVIEVKGVIHLDPDPLEVPGGMSDTTFGPEPADPSGDARSCAGTSVADVIFQSMEISLFPGAVPEIALSV